MRKNKENNNKKNREPSQQTTGFTLGGQSTGDLRKSNFAEIMAHGKMYGLSQLPLRAWVSPTLLQTHYVTLDKLLPSLGCFIRKSRLD